MIRAGKVSYVKHGPNAGKSARPLPSTPRQPIVAANRRLVDTVYVGVASVKRLFPFPAARSRTGEPIKIVTTWSSATLLSASAA
jgi:hypothetical protein